MKIFLSTLLAACLGMLLMLMALGWLFYTPSGTNWGLNRLQALSSDALVIGQREGSLIGVLRLKDIEFTNSEYHIRIARLDADSRITSFFPFKIELGKFQLEQLKAQVLPAGTDQGEAAGGVTWPQIPWFIRMLELDLQQVDIRDVEYVQGDNPRQRIDLLQGELSWQSGRLEVASFQLVTPVLKSRGSLRLNVDRPEFVLDSVTDSLRDEDFWQQLELEADLQPEPATQALRGALKGTLTERRGEQVQALADLEITGQMLRFRKFQLQRPGRPGIITATGVLSLHQHELELDSLLQLEQLNLERETGQPLQLTGSIEIKGVLDAYRGHFSLKNRAVKLADISLTGQFSGNRRQLRLSELSGQWLAGHLSGQALVALDENGWQLTTELVGNQLDPQFFHTQLAGELNLKVSAGLKLENDQAPQGVARLKLMDSSLQGQPVSGAASIILKNRTLLVDQFQLQGKEMFLQASGNPTERLSFSWRVDRLEQLLTDMHGSFSGHGWLRWQQPVFAVEFTSEGTALRFQQWQLDKLSLAGKTPDIVNGALRLHLNGQGFRGPSPIENIDQLKLKLEGNLPDHQLAMTLTRQQDSLAIKLQGGWSQQQWQGRLMKLQAQTTALGRWQLERATTLLFSREQFSLDPLSLRNAGGSELTLGGDFAANTGQTSGQLNWHKLDLSLLQPWLKDWQVSGKSSGQLKVDYGVHNSVYGESTFAGEVQRPSLRLKLVQGRLQGHWDQSGLQSSLQLGLADGGQLEGTLSSTQPADFKSLQQLEFSLNGQGLPLVTVHPWLPPSLNLVGQLALKSAGHWQSGSSVKITGQAKATKARFYWQEEEGFFGTDIDSAELNWNWDNKLKGDFNLDLGDYGGIEATFNLPVTAQLPLTFDPTVSIQADVQARLQELGLLSLLFPGQLQDSRGHLKLSLQLGGTFAAPTFAGGFHLFGGHALVPLAGIQLNEIEASGALNNDLISLDSLRLASGKGQLKGHGRLELLNWRPKMYHLELNGENFQLINQPELQVQVDPQLELQGDWGHYRIRGKLSLPEVFISGRQHSSLATNSPDLVVIDRKATVTRQQRWQHDIDIELLLGDRVLVNTAGLNGRLEGKVRLQSTATQDLVARGEVRVAKGTYSSYGLKLDIERGNLYFTGGPLSQPTLDIQALRTVGEVKAGVKVSGTPQLPTIQLYSEPTMAETDILSYLVLGRPVDSSGNETGLLVAAAGALLSQGESVVLQEKLKNRLGLDVLDFSAGNGDINDSTITTGKYLTPDIYVSLGYSLFRNTNELKIRYSLTPSWEIESSIGSESGIDLYHRFEIE